MASLQSLFIYLFWPNPGNAHYGTTSMLAALIACGLLVVFAFTFRLWRNRMGNPVLKKLSRSWSSAAFWFGVSGIVMVVSRVEGIGFLAMRFLWVLWAIALALFLIVQIRLFRLRYYEKLPVEGSDDPRDRYLPRRKK